MNFGDTCFDDTCNKDRRETPEGCRDAPCTRTRVQQPSGQAAVCSPGYGFVQYVLAGTQRVHARKEERLWQ